MQHDARPGSVVEQNKPLVAGGDNMSQSSNNGCVEFIILITLMVLLFFITDKLSDIRDDLREQRKQQEVQQFNYQLDLWKQYRREEGK